MFNERARQSGQVALIMVLLLVVVGTIALSVASRSVTDINISKQEQDKIRAFSAAEAGIEDLLSQGISTKVTGSITIGSDTLPRPSASPLAYNYTITKMGEGDDYYNLAAPLAIGETAELVLEGSSINHLTFYWGNKNDPVEFVKPASLEISVLCYDSSSNSYQVIRYAYNARGWSPANLFDTASDGERTVDGVTYISNTKNDINIASIKDIVKRVRIKALYNKATIRVEAVGGVFPAQAYQVKVNATEGSSNAAVEVVQSVGAQAGIFDYALWSGNNISHQP